MGPAPGLLLDGAPREKVRPWRRLGARYLDLFLIWEPLLWIADLKGLDPGPQMTVLLSMIAAAVWVPLEAIFLSIWGTTPGKWALSIRVETVDGGSMTYWRALDRSLNVLLWGLGGQIPGVGVICTILAYQNLTGSGSTRWDRKRFRVVHAPLKHLRWIVAIVVLLALEFLRTYERLDGGPVSRLVE